MAGLIGGLGIAVLLVLAIWLGIKHKKKKDAERREATAEVAADQGWSVLTPQAVKPGGFSLFDRGDTSAITNIAGSIAEGREFQICDFRYSYVDSDSSQTYNRTVARAQIRWPGPSVEIEPTKMSGRLVSRLTRTKVDTGNPEFDSAFDVTSDDRNGVQSAISQAAMTWLLENGEHNYEICEGWVYEDRKRVDISEWPGIVSRVLELAGGL